MKINYVIFLFILFGMIGLVIAYEENVAYPNTSGSVKLEKGWNLVTLFSMEKVFNLALREDIVQSYLQEIKDQGIRAVYIYDRDNKKYIRLYPDPEKTKFLEFSNRVSVKQKGSLTEGGGYVNSAIWVYSDNPRTVNFKTTDGPFYLNYVGLKSGWNFFAVTPEMKGMRLNDFKGSCVIQKICDYQRNNWQCVETTNMGNNKIADTDSDIWNGILIKVSSDCVLGSSIQAPPALP